MSNCRIEQDWDNDGVKEYFFHSTNNGSQLRVYDPNDAPHVFWYIPEQTFDWDGDGVDEYFSLFKGESFRLQLYDPNDAPHVFWLDSNYTFEEGGGKITILPKAGNRPSLLTIDYFYGDFCGGGSRKNYFSYSPKFGIATALETFSFSDSPAYHYRSAEFLDDGSVTVDEQSSEGEEYWEDYEGEGESSEESMWTMEDGRQVLNLKGVMNTYEESRSPSHYVIDEKSRSPGERFCFQGGEFKTCPKNSRDQKMILFATENGKINPILCVPAKETKFYNRCSSLVMELSKLYSPFNEDTFLTGVQNKEQRASSEADLKWQVDKDSPTLLVWPQQEQKSFMKESKRSKNKRRIKKFIHNLEYTKKNLDWKQYDVNWGPQFSGFEELLVLTWLSSDQKQKAVFPFVVKKDSIVPLLLPSDVRKSGTINIKMVIPTNDATYLVIESKDSKSTYILSIEQDKKMLYSVVLNKAE